MLYHTKLIVFTLIAASVARVSADSEEFGKTVGMLNGQFGGGVMNRKATKVEAISALEYEFGSIDLESYSKQNILGITIAVQQDGRIVLVKPTIFKSVLPLQKTVNSELDSAVKTSEFFSTHSLVQLEEMQAYGLLSRWAIAVLARRDGVPLNFELLDEQKAVINKLFKGSLTVPDVTLLDQLAKIKKIENYAKDIVRFNWPQ